MQQLSVHEWISNEQPSALVITGAIGGGKTVLAHAVVKEFTNNMKHVICVDPTCIMMELNVSRKDYCSILPVFDANEISVLFEGNG
jgi:DNA replication protein DnaC